MRSIILTLVMVPTSVGTGVLADESDQPRLTNPLFAFDNGTGRGRLPPDVQAKMLKELGYAGIGYTGTTAIPKMLAALDAVGLEMFSTYVGANVDSDKQFYDPGLPQAIRQLKGRPTILWLFLRGGEPSTEAHDDRAVRIIREIADMATESRLRVALYPHVGFYVARVEDALRLVAKVDRENVGASFNLCHWLKAGDEPNMELRLKQALPHLLLVSINGADREGGWDRLIQTLDRGEFDVYGFLYRLVELGYSGPIGLQCYGVEGDVRTNLARSMGAWQKFTARMAVPED